MPYVGGDVSSFFGAEAQAATSDAARKMTDKAGQTLEQLASGFTPTKTGKLKAGWHRDPTTPKDNGWTTSVSNDVDYAAYVENGTGLYGPKHAKYLIKPKNPGGTLRFEIGGRIVFAKFVMHPGSPGKYMMLRSLNMLDVGAEALFAATLEEWTHEIEAAAEKDG
jgi:hypothetical protein